MIERTNEQRADRAFRAVLAWRQYGGDESEDMARSIGDLMVALLDCAGDYGDPEKVHAWVWRHYAAEVAEGAESETVS